MMEERSTQEIIAQIDLALRTELEPFLYTALIPGGILDETNKALIKDAAYQAVQSVLQKLAQQKARMALQAIKDATTKENFGDPERNWLISECERLVGRCRALRDALAPFANMGSWGMAPGDPVTKLDRDCARAARVLYGEEWCPEAGTDKGALVKENENDESS